MIDDPPPALARTDTLKAQCTVTPQCPDTSRRGELTKSRSLHTWNVENHSSEARAFVVVLEIEDNLGHAKKKEVPGEIKANAILEDSTSIELTTSYDQAGPVQITAKTTVLVGQERIASHSQDCRFEVP